MQTRFAVKFPERIIIIHQMQDYTKFDEQNVFKSSINEFVKYSRVHIINVESERVSSQLVKLVKWLQGPP